MATQTHPSRFALRSTAGSASTRPTDGAWWPRDRSLTGQLEDLFEHWPPTAGRIGRVLYSPPDWDDHPRVVAVHGRLVKTGSFPRDDTHLIVLTLLDGQRRTLAIIPPDTAPATAAALLREATDTPAPDQPGWDNEGGHL